MSQRLATKLSRFASKCVHSVKTSLRDNRKQWQEMWYDLRRLPKRQLQTVYQVILFTGTVFPAAGYAAVNTYYLDKYKDWLSIKVDGRCLPLDDSVEELALREWNVSHISRKYKLMDLMEFFLCSGTQVFSVGDLNTRSGAIVGLPHNFSYNTVDDIKLSEISIYGVNAEQLEPDSEAAEALKQLIQSLVLSENAKKFAITRELHLCNNDRVINGMLTTIFASFLGIGVAQQIILSTRIRRRHFQSLGLRLVFLTFGVFSYLVVREMCYYSWMSSADKAAIAQGEAYYDGAVEYYNKLLQREQALKQLRAGNKIRDQTVAELALSLMDIKGVPPKKCLEKVYELNPRADDEDEGDAMSSD